MTKPLRFDIGDREIQDDNYFAVIEPVFLFVSIYDGPQRYEEDLAHFSTEQRLVLAYHWYLSEVTNGGHDQFYWNSTGIVWPDAVKAFRELGHPEVVVGIPKLCGEKIRYGKDVLQIARVVRQNDWRPPKTDWCPGTIFIT